MVFNHHVPPPFFPILPKHFILQNIYIIYILWFRGVALVTNLLARFPKKFYALTPPLRGGLLPIYLSLDNLSLAPSAFFRFPLHSALALALA